jgi:DNA polymerase elongation subunit (family B)
MSRLEVLTLMLSLEALLETDNVDKAKELIKEVITEARTIKRTDEQEK